MKTFTVGPDQRAKVLQTELGFEPAFSWKDKRTGIWGEFEIEPGFVKPTRAEAETLLEKDLEHSRQVDGASRMYAAQYAYASGYHD